MKQLISLLILLHQSRKVQRLFILVLAFLPLWTLLTVDISSSINYSDDDLPPRRFRYQQLVIKELFVFWNPSMNNQDDSERIFFHETSGRTELSFSQSCSIESAALHNPQRPIQLFFQPWQLLRKNKSMESGMIDPSSAWFKVLNKYSNVQVIVIDDEELYFTNSPFEDWYRKGQFNQMSQFIRILSLYKQGGMYLDLDVLTVKPYDGPLLRNFVTANFDAIHLDKGHPFIGEIIKVQTEDNSNDKTPSSFNGLCLGPGACSDIQLLSEPYWIAHGQKDSKSYAIRLNNSAIELGHHCPLTYASFNSFSFI